MRSTSRWKAYEVDPAKVDVIQKHTEWPAPLVRAMVRRGVDHPDDLDAYLHPRLSRFPDPFHMPGMAGAAARIWKAVDRGEQIVVHGDYDVDGITSTALVVRVLQAVGAKVSAYLPHRVDDGYGLQTETVTHCIDQLGAQLLITVDCGTGSVDAVETARKKQVDVIVTDHHHPPETLAHPLALLNPRCWDVPDWNVFAGVGIAFMLCYGLLKAGRDLPGNKLEGVNLKQFIDLVAVGTVADMVPLQGYNRAFVRTGLQILETTRNPGLNALARKAGLEPPFSAQDIGFGLGPRLNAAGRLGTAETSLALLTTEDQEEAEQLADELHATNRERRAVEKQTLEQAVQQIEERGFTSQVCLVVAQQGWHPGVIGIVASRLVRKYARPALVIAIDDNGEGKGSCRSIEGFPMVDALDACSSNLAQHGGHQMAAGFSLAAADIDLFRQDINDYASTTLRLEDLRLTLVHDGEMDLGELDEEFLDRMDELSPFGSENPEPCWLFKQVQIISSRIVGENHLKLEIGTGARSWNAIGFGQGRWVDYEGCVDMIAVPFVNRFRGRTSVELRVLDLAASGIV